MDKELDLRFSDGQLRQVVEEAFVYTCACPAQVAEQILKLRALHSYQMNCIDRGPLSEETHRLIAAATLRAHADLETCLHDILTLEGWDMVTLTMPTGLREVREKDISA